MRSIFVGYDSRQADAFAIARRSIRKFGCNISIGALCQQELRGAGLYSRSEELRGSQLWCNVSDAPMATEFSNSRFLTPFIAGSGLALFIDCDMLARTNLSALFACADTDKAVMCVQHPDYEPGEAIKMDGRQQTRYKRKNWSSVMLFNTRHPANQRVTLEMVNTLPGRDLHRFCWLQDDEIGALPPEWNWLEGISDPSIEPAMVHFTRGLPHLPGYENSAYAGEWFDERRAWLSEHASRIADNDHWRGREGLSELGESRTCL